MKPLFRLFLWLSVLLMGVPGSFTASTALHRAGEVLAHITGQQGRDNGYYLSPQHQDASFGNASKDGKRDLFITECENDCTSQIQLKKHNPAVFGNYFADLYGPGSGYVRHLKTRLPGNSYTHPVSVQRHIVLCVIRI